MQQELIQILLVEDNRGDARLFRLALAEVNVLLFDLTHCERLTEALQSLAEVKYDILFLDLSLPDSQGLETFYHLHERCPDVPVIVLTGSDDETLAVNAVKAGAQDYLYKGQVESHILVRAMRYAIERHRMQESLRSLSLTDELTGLYNRRGFVTFVEQHLKVAFRTKRGISVIFVDLDGMKQINDFLGHAQGDAALLKTAEVLKKTFRESDILARIGGDEFAIAVLDTNDESACVFCARLQENVTTLNADADSPFTLSLSIGLSHYNSVSHCTVDALLAQADSAMYEQKRAKKASMR